MTHELFVEQPVLDCKEGIKVTEETVISYKNARVTQSIRALQFETHMEEDGISGNNCYKTVSSCAIALNPGDILLFDENRGYYMPTYPVESIEDAISDIRSLEGLPRFREVDK